jgi:hypothetical protein
VAAEDDQPDEAARVWAWRYEEALEAGLTPQQAEVFASGTGDLETLRRMRRQGCDRDTAFDIVT